MNQPSPSPQKTPRKRKQQDGFMSQFDAYIGRAQAFLQEFFARAGKPVDTIYQVGVQRYREGEFADAANRFRMVTRMRPDWANAWFLLGQSELAIGNSQQAGAAFQRCLSLDPQNDEARFLLAVNDPAALPRAQEPKFAPLSLVTSYFEGQALDYDAYNLDELGYFGHEQCFVSVSKYLNPDYKQLRVLDLGCGTGLVGLQFRAVAGLIHGVDLAQNMLDQAELRRDERESRIYDKLAQADLRHFLLEAPVGGYDVIAAANVFPYVGGLTPVFDGVAHALRTGGLFSFTVEPEEGTEYGLVSGQGRYAHSQSYIEEQAARVGLDVLEITAFEMFEGEQDELQFVLRKPSPQGQQTQVATPESGQTPPGNIPPPAAG